MTGISDKTEKTGKRALDLYYGISSSGGQIAAPLIDTHLPRLPENVHQIRRFWLTPEVEEALRDHSLVSSIAHVRMLGATGIVPKEVATKVEEGLLTIMEECRGGICLLTALDTDINQSISRRLYELVGELAAVIDLARSPNDSLAVNIRLYLRQAVVEIFAKLLRVREILLKLAERDMDAPMPGHTHMQPACAILLSHFWLANEARFARDFDRLTDLYKRLNLSPLGAASLAGTSKPIDREMVAFELGFDGLVENSIDAVSDRDFVVEFASFAAICGIHYSQLASELLLWSTQEFDFVRLPRALTIKSPNMPHKRNPELLELLRARTALFSGRLSEFICELKGLPVSYSGDLKECLPGLVDVVENLRFVTEVAATVLPAFKFNLARMQAQAHSDLTNASMAVDYLIERATPQEKAREVVENLGDYCKKRHRQLTDLTLSEWQQFSPAFEDDIYGYLQLEVSVESLTSRGGTATPRVMEGLSRAASLFSQDSERLPPLVKELLASK
jgi:argininosuccinate lyase